MGLPGAGKSTVTIGLNAFGIPVFHGGQTARQMVREESRAQLDESDIARLRTAMELGSPIPPDLARPLVNEFVDQARRSSRVCFLDGYPRSKAQFELLVGDCSSQGGRLAVVYLKADPWECAVRLSARVTCASCGYSTFREVKNECPTCGHLLTRRADDNEVDAALRLSAYIRDALPLVGRAARELPFLVVSTSDVKSSVTRIRSWVGESGDV